MGGGSSRQTIQCDANEWTRIMRGGGLIARTYRVKFSTEGDVEWRRRSGGPPFYLSGTWRVRDHDTHSQRIRISPTDVYVQYDVKPKVAMAVTVSVTD